MHIITFNIVKNKYWSPEVIAVYMCMVQSFCFLSLAIKGKLNMIFS